MVTHAINFWTNIIMTFSIACSILTN